MKHTIPSNVKPLVLAIALAGASAAVQAQPIVSIGGSFNVSAAASLSSSLPPLNSSQSLNAGYSGGADISLPSNDGDAVQSVISELMADSNSDQSLPGLSLPEGDGSNAPSGEGEASAISDTATEVSGTLEGLGDSQPSGQLDVSAVTHAAADVAAKLNEQGESGGDNSGPETPEAPEDEVTPEDSDSGDDVADTQAPDGEVFASAVTETVAEASGQLGGGSSPNMGLIANGANRTAAEATARLRDVEPSSDEPSAPDAPDLESAEIAAAAESQTEATAVASLN